MKKIFSITFISIIVFGYFTNIYDYSFLSAEGNIINLNSYQQKKIIFVTLPISQNNETNNYLERLDSLSRAHTTGIVMIGVPSYEDGYTSSSASTLNAWYRSKIGNQIIIGQGMYTRKNSSDQNQIFRWLTDKNLNSHFDIDVSNWGQQFFISGSGELVGVLGPEAKWSNRIFNKLVQ
jgi:glutathione peroxidase-family protein